MPDLSDSDWRELSLAAKAGNTRALDQVARKLIEWARSAMHQQGRTVLDELAVDFAAHLLRDGIGRLTELPPQRRDWFLRRSFKHFLIDRYRQEKSRLAHEVLFCELLKDDYGSEIAVATCQDPETIVLNTDSADQIWLALDQLGEVSRVLFFLRYAEGWTSRQLGAKFGMSDGAVRERLRSIRRRLREQIGTGGK